MTEIIGAFTKKDISWRVTRPGRYMLWVTIPGMPKMQGWYNVWSEDEAVGLYLESINTIAVRTYMAKRV